MPRPVGSTTSRSSRDIDEALAWFEGIFGESTAARSRSWVVELGDQSSALARRAEEPRARHIGPGRTTRAR